jgi:hypothetical protein
LDKAGESLSFNPAWFGRMARGYFPCFWGMKQPSCWRPFFWWWQPVVMTAATFSSIIYILLWDGAWQHLHDKGGVGLLINLAIWVALLIFQWPDFDF